jgi:diguanylate cyclase (GGDEF)-like protein
MPPSWRGPAPAAHATRLARPRPACSSRSAPSAPIPEDVAELAPHAGPRPQAGAPPGAEPGSPGRLRAPGRGTEADAPGADRPRASGSRPASPDGDRPRASGLVPGSVVVGLLDAMLEAACASPGPGSGRGTDDPGVLQVGLEHAVRAAGALGGLVVRRGSVVAATVPLSEPMVELVGQAAAGLLPGGAPGATGGAPGGWPSGGGSGPAAVRTAPLGRAGHGSLVLLFPRSTTGRPSAQADPQALDRGVQELAAALALGLRMAAALSEERALRLRSEAQAEEALLDPLTHLPNRRLFLDRLDQAVARAERTGCSLAVVFMDMDGFKFVNDSLGHGAGDQLLVGVAERLRAITRPPDTVARMGGDEFALLLEALDRPSRAEAVACRITEALEEPFVLWGKPVVARASLGIALRTDAGEDATDLLRHADLAMYQAKACNRGRPVLFERGMHVALVRRLQVEEDLRAALRRASPAGKGPVVRGAGELVLRFQPIVALETGRLVGLEALVRWRHPVRGLLAPAEFVPVAEETGLAAELGAVVLARAAAAARSWRERSPGVAAELNLAVNVSPRELARPGYSDGVALTLDQVGLPPDRLVLEITETAALADRSGIVLRQLEALRDLGVALALDDFGTGYSSLSQLWRLPATILKVDRAFVAGVADDDSVLGALTQSVVQMGRELGMDTVAEGVETVAQLERLVEVGCQYGQGYLFSPPLSAEGVHALLAGWTRALCGTPVVVLPGRARAPRTAPSGDGWIPPADGPPEEGPGVPRP